jgi:hypothetical protein
MDLRRMFRPEREEVEKGQRKLHSEELHIFYASPIVISVIKLRRNSMHRRGEKCIQNFCGETRRVETTHRI